MFERSLQDLVKGIRNAADPAAFIAKANQEIKDELKSRDVTIKAQALQKLTYLNMLGHDMSWAAFHVIEVMSQERFALKRIGMLACSLSFTSTTDVIVLCTQLLKKEFSARSPYEIGLAINCLANIATEDLSRDLLSDVVTMLTSTRAYVRKKATLVLLKLYMRYPQGLRLTFDNLKRRLTDDDPAVVTCAINVICELARKKPSNYLSLAPELFELMTTSTNNWMLIKIAKLMSALVQEEPRLARKLLEPLARLVQDTSAKSLMYECVSALTYALQYTKRADGTDAKNAGSVVRLCTDKLREMVREPDQNLKYLGLTGLMNLMRSNPRVVAEHRELVLQCLVDEDVTIRLRALELITGMVTRRNLPDIVARFIELLETAEGHWRDELIEKIIFICARDKYAYLTDFAWYLSILVKLAHIPGTKHAALIASQMLEVAVRVEDVRPQALRILLPLLADAELINAARAPSAAAATAMVPVKSPDAAAKSLLEAEEVAAAAAAAGETDTPLSGGMGALSAGQVLFACAWIVGEFCAMIPPQLHANVLDALLQPSTLTLCAQVQGVYIQAALKVLSAAATYTAKAGHGAEETSAFVSLAASVLHRLLPFSQSVHVEVQERACLVQQLLATLGVPFTPVASPLTAEAVAEADLMSLAGAPAASSAAAGGATGSALPPLEPDVRLIAAVLSNLFSEPLKPVNPKAQRKVPVPTGLDLDKWIRPEQARAAEAERSSSFKYDSVSFEDSYGVTDDEFAGGSGAATKGSRKGGKNVSAADAEDDEWLADLARKNKKRDKELWGDDSPRKGKGSKASRAAGSSLSGGKSAEESRHAGNAFMLGSGKGAAAGRRAHNAPEEEEDVEDIPIRQLGAIDLKSSLDVGIFGDFGKKPKAAKKGKSRRAAVDDDSEEEAVPAPRRGGRASLIMADEDMPEGAVSSDEDEKASAAVDALASVDLTTPLRDDETLPVRAHRTTGAGKAAAGGKKGRARVLGGEEEPAAAAGAGASTKSKKKTGKAAEVAAAPVEEDKPKKKKKAAAAAAVEAGTAPAASSKSSKAGTGVAAAPTRREQGDAYAAAPEYWYTLFMDKGVKLTYSITCKPLASGAGSSAAGAAAETTATILVRVDPKLTKKTVDWVDMSFPVVFPLQRTGLAAGAEPGAVRVASSLKERLKGKNRSQRTALPVTLSDLVHTAVVPVTLTYQVTGAAAPVTAAAVLRMPAASVLIPTRIEAEAYRNLMTTEGAAFTHAVAHFDAPTGTPASEVMSVIVSALRSYAVVQSDQHAILYACTTSGAHVTALLKLDSRAQGVDVTLKSVLPGHAAVLVDDLTFALAPLMAAAGADDE